MRDLSILTAQAWDAVAARNDPAALFLRGNLPVRVDLGADHVASIVPLDQDRLRHALSRAARIMESRGRGEPADAFAPHQLLADMLACPTIPLPVFDHVAAIPFFAPDGTLIATPGYHPAARSLQLAPPSLAASLHAELCGDDINGARHLLLDELLGDFAFVSEADRAAILAALLHPIVRPMIDGPTPLHLIDKPAPGSGAGLLVDVIVWIVTGQAASVMTEGRDEDEWRKRITSKHLTNPLVIVLDNLRHRLDSAAVAAALTTTYWEDRMLGQSSMVRLPARALWLATGNNVSLSNEISRRTIRCRLDTGVERPWTRTGFRHDPLLCWVREKRKDLLQALVVLVQAWLLAGRPYRGLKLGSFESWSTVIGGTLETAEIGGFLGNIETMYAEADAEGRNWRRFVLAWHAEIGEQPTTAGELHAVALAMNPPFDKLGSGNEHSQKTRLGKALASARDKVFTIEGVGVVRIAAAGETDNAVRWQLRRQA